MANRFRNERIEIKLTKEEKALFEEKMKMAKCKTMNHFLRKVVSESNIYVVDLQPFREIQGSLFRYANSVKPNC
ncbi:plasmid mobilization protein [Megasphaera lornae]|uniref:plasmid mobilization protein n=1 Tax=Megasphaera lornae TaxID=1000568 RepID=UPI0040398A84